MKLSAMIQPNELRLGNLINCNSGKIGFCSVQAIYKDAVVVKSLPLSLPFYFSADADTIEPIKLNSELLQSAGVEQIKNSQFFEIDLGENIGQIHINPMTGNPYYLHQLQNLFFSLTGEELKINFNNGK